MIDHKPCELLISSRAWSDALRGLATRPGCVAAGPARREPGRSPPAILVDALTLRDSPPRGADWPPLADWILLAMPGGEPPADPGPWLDRLRPAFGQRFVLLLIGFGPDESVWQGWVCERGQTSRLDRFHVLGSESFQARNTAAESSPGAVPDFFEDEARWSRTRGALGPAAFARIRQAKVVVVGCSRSGTLAAAMLVALGVRRMAICDEDRIEPHNLDGLLLATPGDVGRNKAEVLAERLVAFREDLSVSVVPRGLGARAAEPALTPFDLIVTCVDQDPPRLRAAWLARQQLAPHLDLASGVTRENGSSGESRRLAADARFLLPAQAGGCVRCVGGLHALEEADRLLRAPAGALPRRGPAAWDAAGRLGSLITLNAALAATGVQSWLDLLAGELAEGIWHRLEWRFAAGWQAHSAQVASRPDCPLCHPPVGTTYSPG